MTTYYKVLAEGAQSCHGGDLTWPRPRGKRLGAWVSVSGKIVLCQNGLHVVTADRVLDWNGKEVWEVEIDGDTVTDGRKIAARRARLVRLAMDERGLRRFAVECAARVLPIFEQRFPHDARLRDALRVLLTGEAAEAARAADAADAARAAEAAWAAWAAEAADAARAAWASRAAEAARAARAAWAARAARAAWASRAAEAARAAWASRAAEAAEAAWAARAADAAARADEHAWQFKRLKRYLSGKVDLTKPVRLPKKVSL